jgi:hypothetical protein
LAINKIDLPLKSRWYLILLKSPLDGLKDDDDEDDDDEPVPLLLFGRKRKKKNEGKRVHDRNEDFEVVLRWYSGE